MSVTAITIAMMSVTVNKNYDGSMTRWQPDSRGRLEKAAFELYGERGFDDTTVAEIADRAGLTERTFFRHFSDKREILFAGASDLQELFVNTVVAAPDASSPVEAVALALDAVGTLFESRRAFSRQRQTIILGSTELQERELIKLATLSTALAGALRQRGVEEPTASLTGEIAIAVFKISFDQWVDERNELALTQLMRDALAKLKSVTADE
jgi:AcrR family transcriptional regulator